MVEQKLTVTGEQFEALSVQEQAAIIQACSCDEQRLLLRALPLDDAADLLQQFAGSEQFQLLGLLTERARFDVTALLAYAEDVAGGLMNPSYLRVRAQMDVREALLYVRKQLAGSVVSSSYVYVLDGDQKLLGVLSLKQLVVAEASASAEHVDEIMAGNPVKLNDTADQEEVANAFTSHGFIALPVVDAAGVMKGIVTADDVISVVQDEATKDIQKLGGSEALDIPYLSAPLSLMIRKRAGWLVTLFLGELLTASAMNIYQDELSQAIVLTLFLPLIISSGGNAGSQASTLVIRSMALGEIKLSDWWKVGRREIVAGLLLGLILAAVGLARILVWQGVFGSYGEHYALVAATVAFSLIGVVLWGSLSGSLLPFILRRCGFDPATASTPFVATLVDVTGLVIYFEVAKLILKGALL